MAEIRTAQSTLFPHGSQQARVQVLKAKEEAKKKRRSKKKKKSQRRTAGRIGK